MATSGGNFVSIAHLEIPLLIKMLMCQILIFPAVYIYIYIYIYIMHLKRAFQFNFLILHFQWRRVSYLFVLLNAL